MSTSAAATGSPSAWSRTRSPFGYGAYGVDGFRFDLARVLADGSTNAAAWVDLDPRFGPAHLHAEPWDLGGQWWDFMDSAGWDFSNNRWVKWVGKYRDDARQFSESDLRNPSLLKRLIEGRGAVPNSGAPASSKPWRSINFVAIHDGYTLRDCMALQRQRRLAELLGQRRRRGSPAQTRKAAVRAPLHLQRRAASPGRGRIRSNQVRRRPGRRAQQL